MPRRSQFWLWLSLAAVGCGARTDLAPPEGNSSESAPPPDVLSIAEVSAKWDHVCAIGVTGRLSCWGNNGSGEIGVAGAPAFVPSPLPVDPEHAYRKVSAGVMTTCAIRRDGTLWCWGRNEGGPLATGDRMPHTTPIEIGSDHDWDDVSVGSGMACGLRTGGRLYCWGSPDHGAPPTSNPLGPNVLLQPTLIEGTWTAIASHWYATMAIRDDGSLWATTNDGKFVHLDEVEGSAARVSVGPLYSLMVNVGGGLSRIKIIFGDEDDAIQEPETSGVVFGGAVATAYGSCAISADGSMYCGDEHSEDPPHLAPLGDDHHDWMTVGVGTGFACGSRKDGSIWCWGTLSSQPGGPKADYGALPQRVE